jgi:hypothetical protein
MNLTEATRLYQDLLEGHRALTLEDPHDLQEDVTTELHKARTAMEIAWLNHTTR